MCKIKTINGETMRNDAAGRTAFFCEQVKFVCEQYMSGSWEIGEKRLLGASGVEFELVSAYQDESTGVHVATIRRTSNGVEVTVKIVGDGEKMPSSQDMPKQELPKQELPKQELPKQELPKQEPTPALAPAAPAAPAQTGNAVQDALAELTAAISRQQTRSVDLAEVAELRQTIAEMQEREVQTREYCSGLFEAVEKQNAIIKNLQSLVDELKSSCRRVKVQIGEMPEIEHADGLHPQAVAVIKWASVRKCVYMVGPSGTGKTSIAKAVAKQLGLKFYSTGALLQKFELTGFIDAKGKFADTALYQAMKEGGVYLFDEMDGSSPEALLAFNEITANGSYTFPNDECVQAHPDFVLLGAGNTVGRGATSTHVARFVIDGSTLDRFVCVKVGYDPQICLSAAQGDEELVAFADDVRKAAGDAGMTYEFTPRGLDRCATGLALGFSLEETLEMAVFNTWSKDDMKNIQWSLSRGGRWLQAFERICE